MVNIGLEESDEEAGGVGGSASTGIKRHDIELSGSGSDSEAEDARSRKPSFLSSEVHALSRRMESVTGYDISSRDASPRRKMERREIDTVNSNVIDLLGVRNTCTYFVLPQNFCYV